MELNRANHRRDVAPNYKKNCDWTSFIQASGNSRQHRLTFLRHPPFLFPRSCWRRFDTFSPTKLTHAQSHFVRVRLHGAATAQQLRRRMRSTANVCSLPVSYITRLPVLQESTFFVGRCIEEYDIHDNYIVAETTRFLVDCLLLNQANYTRCRETTRLPFNSWFHFYRSMPCERGICCHRVSVCLSVRLSQVGVLPIRLNLGSCKQRRTIAQGF